MQNRIIISILCATASITALAQNATPDSLKTHNLDEVVVEAQMQRTSSTYSTYIPTGGQKNAAQNAIDLLRQMAIPQIQINPVTDAVTDNLGSEVSIFINWFAASKEEMEGLLMQDVKKVEYLEFPSDPRFRGAQRVINIIVQEYYYGGYTKLTTNENFLAGFASRNNIFSKFSFKKMTYDLYVGAYNSDSHYIGDNLTGVYSLINSDGNDYELIRTETLDRSHYKQNQYPFTLRATYASEKIQIRNTVGFAHTSTPAYNQSGKLTYQPGIEKDYSFERNNPNHNNSLAYQGSFFISLPKQFSLDISPRFTYTHSNDYFSYTTSNSPEISRNAREDAYNYRVDAYLRKNIGQKHTVMLGGNGGDNINRLRYSGTNDYYDRFHNAFAAGMLCYNFQTQKISLYADAGFCWEGSDINGQKYNDTYPFTHINLRFSPNAKNAFSAYFQYATSSPAINQKTADILQDNEYMYITGNPLLKNSRHITLNLAYTWMPSNNLGVSAYSQYSEVFNRHLYAYNLYNSGTALLRTVINDGNKLSGEIGIAVNWKLLNGKLQLYAKPKQSLYKSTGIYDKSYNPFSITFQATYYLNKFYFQAYYQSPEKGMYTMYPQIYKNRNFHSLTVGWANSNWNVRLMAANIFNTGWQSEKTSMETPLYTEYAETINNNYHSRLNIAITYSFGYGKKVQRGNEVGEQSGANSAIMK